MLLTSKITRKGDIMKYLKSKDEDIRESEKLWDSLISSEYYMTMYPILGYGFQLYAEAIKAFASGAYMATAVMCRATLDAILYTLISREPKISGEIIIKEEVLQEVKRYGVPFIICLAITEGLLIGEEIKTLIKTRNKGNLAAHLVEKVDAEFKAFFEKYIELRKQGKTLEMKVELEKFLQRIAITRDEALDSLKNTLELILKIIERYAEKHPYMRSWR
ncbi:MAG: hypothetical protein B6U76_00805 [Desulfurococcales archaeon ex4484_217_2]|nr:MAG: hypothetical protein B6U76_00805 [Desulfurococcales archaeon ex4484_217_2]